MIYMTSNGITYALELGGVRDTEKVAVLYRRAEHTNRDIEDAKREITKFRNCERFRIVDLAKNQERLN